MTRNADSGCRFLERGSRMKKIGIFFVLFLLYSCATPHNHQNLSGHPHLSHKLSYWDVSHTQYNLLKNSKLKFYVESEATAAFHAHQDMQSEWEMLDLVWPTSGTLTSQYGMRKLRKRTRMHQGIDIGARFGTPVYAAETGRVKFNGRMRGYGRVLILKHDSLHDTLYAHLSRTAVKANQIVRKNQLIGYIGRTGYTTGANLHFEMRVMGKSKDPLHFLPKSRDKKRVRVGEAIIVRNRHIATKSESKYNSKS